LERKLSENPWIADARLRKSRENAVDNMIGTAFKAGLNWRVPDPSRFFEGSESLGFPPLGRQQLKVMKWR
jgi:hypothetical protein